MGLFVRTAKSPLSLSTRLRGLRLALGIALHSMYATDLGAVEDPDSLGIKDPVWLNFRVRAIPIWVNDPAPKTVHFEAAIIVRCLF